LPTVNNDGTPRSNDARNDATSIGVCSGALLREGERVRGFERV
jgi:hypothetical protein